MKPQAALLLVLLTVAGCSSGTSTQPTANPQPGTAQVTTEMFTGTVPVKGADIHNFTVMLSNGQMTATLTAAGPPPTIQMGFGLGVPTSDGNCNIQPGFFIIVAAGTATSTLTATQVSAGTYCFAVGDVGNQANDVTYGVTVTHY